MSAATATGAGTRSMGATRLATGRSEAGSAAAEIVILTPLLVMLALLFVVGGRLANALQEVGDAARTSVESAVPCTMRKLRLRFRVYTIFGRRFQRGGTAPRGRMA